MQIVKNVVLDGGSFKIISGSKQMQKQNFFEQITERDEKRKDEDESN